MAQPWAVIHLKLEPQTGVPLAAREKGEGGGGIESDPTTTDRVFFFLFALPRTFTGAHFCH